MSNYESSRLSEDEVPLTPMSENPTSPDNVRHSIITYSTDLGESSIAESTTTHHVEEELPIKRASSRNSKRMIPSESFRFCHFCHQRRFWAICISVSVVLSAIFIPLLFLIIIPNVAQSSVNKSNLEFQSLNITNPKNDSFTMDMVGKTDGAGPFGASITFNGPVNLLYQSHLIGSVDLDPIKVSGGSGTLGGHKIFTINNKTLLSKLSSTMLTDDSFVWTLQGTANVQAFGTNTKITLDKDIKIPGSDGFVTTLESLNITQTPAKTLDLTVTANLFNPSPIGIELGTLNLQFGYNGTIMSNATAKDFFLVNKNNTLTLTGTAIIPTTDADRNNYFKVVEAYLTGKPINTTSKVLSVEPKNGPVDWLSEAIASMAPLSASVGSEKPPDIIKGVDFGEMSLKFTPDTAYSPTISSKNIIANVQLPFDIDFTVSSIKQNLKAYYKGNPMFELDSPTVPATNTATEISVNLPEQPLKVLSNDLFSDFLTAVTASKGADIVLVGESSVNATTIIGTSVIEGIAFNISTSITGFNQFSGDGGGGTSSGNFSVLGGTTDQIFLSAVITIINPLQYSFSSGKVTLHMIYQDQTIGSIVINDLTIGPGTNYLGTIITLDDPVNNSGLDLLTAFLSEQPIALQAKGFDGSTDIASLKQAFGAINISSNIPPLKQNLVQGARMSSNANTPIGVVDIANIYDAPISIYTVNATITFGGSQLGSIDLDIRNQPLFIPGHTVKSIQLPVNINFDPVLLFAMTRDLALQHNLDVSVFDQIIAMSKVDIPGVVLSTNPTPEALESFDLKTFITTALSIIPTTVNMESTIALGYYFLPIKYKQDIVTKTDISILQFIPKIAGPTINQVVGQTNMSIDSVFIHDIDVGTFDVTLAGKITNTGPLRGEVTVPNGLTISSNNVNLATVQLLTPLALDPTSGINLASTSKVVISDIPTFTNWIQQITSATGTDWSISGNAVANISGIAIGPISVNKSMNLPGFSNNIKTFNLVSTDITGGGNNAINFEFVVALTNPSIIGIELGTIVFNIFVENKLLTTVTANNVVINANTASNVTFQGSLPLDGSISQLLAPNPPQLLIQGASVRPPKATGDVVWLSTLFKGFSTNVPFDLKNVIKPPASQK